MTAPLSVLLFSLLSLLFPPQKATLVFAGDAMQHKSQLDNARRAGGGWDYSECFAEVSPWIKAADYAIVNLETTLGEKGFTGYPCFCSPDAFAEALKEAGFDLFLNANNHTLDRRDRGLKRTLTVLDSIGADHIGTYRNRDERKQRMPFVKEVNGFRIAFLNYTYGTNGLKVSGDAVVDYIDREVIASDIKNARQAGAEIIVVIPHWGTEYRLLPDSYQKYYANFLSDAGADIVMGGHPHVIEPMEMRTDANGRKQLLVYSLGNFISGMRTTDTRGGALAKVVLSRDKDGKAIIESAGWRLVYVVKGTPGKKADRLVFIDNDEDITDSIPASSQYNARAFTRNAVGTFTRHNKGVERVRF